MGGHPGSPEDFPLHRGAHRNRGRLSGGVSLLQTSPRRVSTHNSNLGWGRETDTWALPPGPRARGSGIRPFHAGGVQSGPQPTHAPAGGGGGKAAGRSTRRVLISSVFPALTPPPGVPASPRAAAPAAAAVARSPRPPPSGGGDDSGLSGPWPLAEGSPREKHSTRR